jgi:hypothetical protein
MQGPKELYTQRRCWASEGFRHSNPMQTALITINTVQLSKLSSATTNIRSASASSLEHGVNSPHDVVLDSLLLFLVLNLLDTGASCVLIHTWAADQLPLVLSHASIDIDILGSDPQRTVRRDREPAVNFPHQIQKNEERRRHVGLEETLHLEIWPANWVERDVELGNERNGADGEAHPRAPDTKSGFVWNFIEGVAVVEPR